MAESIFCQGTLNVRFNIYLRCCKWSKDKKQIEKVRQAILAGAKQIFVNKGFAGASNFTNRKNAGVSQGLIYHYFEDKVQLWKEVKKDAMEQANLDASFGAQEAKSF